MNICVFKLILDKILPLSASNSMATLWLDLMVLRSVFPEDLKIYLMIQ